MSQQPENPINQNANGTAAPAMPDNMMGMIADLLSQQQQWQQRQSDSEQLIARMAEKLEHSQKSIETLTGMLSETPEVPAAIDSDSGSGEPMSWESQKQRLMAGYSADTTKKVIDSVVADANTDSNPAPVETEPPATAPPVKSAAPVPPAADEEWKSLGTCEESTVVRRLRLKLEDKLRDAEIEISIERARIHRARREMEQQRMDFEREVIKMRDEENSGKGKSRNKNKKKQDSRWERFLGDSAEGDA